MTNGQVFATRGLTITPPLVIKAATDLIPLSGSRTAAAAAVQKKMAQQMAPSSLRTLDTGRRRRRRCVAGGGVAPLEAAAPKHANQDGSIGEHTDDITINANVEYI